jgi:ceramide glucosyltransferase
LISTVIYYHFAVWRDVLLLLATGPSFYYVAASFSAWRFFRKKRGCRFAEFTPPVSVIKPVCGVDFASYENFASFCRQDYPDYEILFAVNDLSDPAVGFVRQLAADFPERGIRLLSGAARNGTNQKVNNLALLAHEAKHEVLVMSDGDVRVGPNYLREVVAPLHDPETGAVTCLYRGLAQRNLLAELEAVGVASDFSASVLLAAATQGVQFALGASIATTKEWLGKVGGFESFGNMLADDYELGNRIAKAGGRVEVSREVVCTMYPAQSMRGFWEHQLRWARTIRLCRPASYLGLLLTQGLPWTVLAVAVAPTRLVAAAYLGAYVVLRLLMALIAGVWGLQDATVRRKFWLVPLRDAVNFCVWLASFASNRVVWGDVQYQMEKGQMIPVR